MPKILVVVEGKDQAVAAIAQLMDSGERTGLDHVLILNVHPQTQPWQQSNTPKMLLEHELQRQTEYIRNATAPWLAEAGITFEARNCSGDVAKTVSRIVQDERCDEILIAEPRTGRWTRFVERMTGKRPASYLDRIIPEVAVPVSVVKAETVERSQGPVRTAGPAKPGKPGDRQRNPTSALA